jgi:4a-hydroxytetrahydrobiopterin dehydratase
MMEVYNMANRTRLSEEEIRSALAALPAWSVVEGKLRREYKFRDFTYAFGFMATAATAIEKRDHHPQWLNVYNRVTVELTTHDAGGITAKDIELAQVLEEIATRLQ